jgi:molybdopterin converting factor small subunit
MSVRILYTAQVRTTLGLASEEVDLAMPCTARELLEHLAEKHGEPFHRLVWAREGGLQPAILVCVGDQQIGADLSYQLNDGDEGSILSPIGGG